MTAFFSSNRTEADALADDLEHLAAAVLDGQQQVIEVRRFAAPQARRFHRKLHGDFALCHALGRRDDLAAVEQRHLHAAGADGRIQLHLHREVERRVGEAVVKQRLHADIRDVRLWGWRRDRASRKNAGEAHEILIFQPASRAPALHAAGELVFALDEVIRQLELAGREGIRRETDG